LGIRRAARCRAGAPPAQDRAPPYQGEALRLVLDTTVADRYDELESLI
jgi:hypothetical protein